MTLPGERRTQCGPWLRRGELGDGTEVTAAFKNGVGRVAAEDAGVRWGR
jgi:hypothetical protein